MERIYRYENWKALCKNPPIHSEIDSNSNCPCSLMPEILSDNDEYHNGETIYEITAQCQFNGEIRYYVKFSK